MWIDVEFKDGYKCRLEHLFIWNKCHYYRTEDAYLIVPYQDVLLGRECRDIPKEVPKNTIVWNEIRTKEEPKWKEIVLTLNSESE